MSEKCSCQSCFNIEQGLTLGVGTWINQFQKDATIQLNVHGNHPPCMDCDVDKMKIAHTWVESMTAKSYWKAKLLPELREQIAQEIEGLDKTETSYLNSPQKWWIDREEVLQAIRGK